MRVSAATSSGIILFTATAERAFGRLNFNYNATTTGESYSAVADMNKQVWGGRLSAGVKMRLYGGVYLLGSLDYRLLRFPEFTGTGSVLGQISGDGQPWVSFSSPAQLVGGDHYLGVHFNGGEYYNYYEPSTLYYDTPYRNGIGQNNPPASIDLSGFGGSLGFEFQL